VWLNKPVLGERFTPVMVDLGMQGLWIPGSLNNRRQQTSGKNQRRLRENLKEKSLEIFLVGGAAGLIERVEV